MSKRTAGVRVIDKWGRGYILTQTLKDDLAAKIDAAIRRAQAKAWDECEKGHDLDDCGLNPYRGRSKR